MNETCASVKKPDNMGRKENIKRMKKLREQKPARQAAEVYQRDTNRIAEEAIQVLQKKISPFQPLRRNTGPIKYSDVLSSFVKPYLTECSNYYETQGLFFVGVAAWNVAVTKQVAGDEGFKEAFQRAKEHLKSDEEIRILEELVAIKLKHFALFKVMFRDVVLTETDITDAYGVSVAAISLE
jgi:hypothetical protein